MTRYCTFLGCGERGKPVGDERCLACGRYTSEVAPSVSPASAEVREAVPLPEPQGGELPQAPAQVTRPIDGFAIAGFVLGLVGLSVLGIIFSILGIGRTRHSRGRGLAVAGLALSIAWIVIPLGVIAVVLTQKPSTPEVPVGIGSCFDAADDPSAFNRAVEVSPGETVPCAQPHFGEIVDGPFVQESSCMTEDLQLYTLERVSYATWPVRDPSTDRYWCAAMVTEDVVTGQGRLVTGSFTAGDVTPIM